MKSYLYIILIFQLLACENRPTELVPKNAEEIDSEEVLENSEIFNSENTSDSQKESNDISDVHRVKILEILDTKNYVYLKVSEFETTYWLSTLKMDVVVGEYYYFTGGVLKENFESKEHQRVFDKLLLVKNIVPENHGGGKKKV